MSHTNSPQRYFPEYFHLWVVVVLTISCIARVTTTGENGISWTRSVQVGDDYNITDVPSEQCTIAFAFYNDIMESTCGDASLESVEKCFFFTGAVQPGCSNLRYIGGMIWKQNISEPFSFCAEISCPSSLRSESGLVTLYTGTRPEVTTTSTTAVETPAVTAENSVTYTGTRSTKKTTVSIPGSSSVSSVWRDIGITFILLFIIVLLTALFLVTFLARRKRQRNMHSFDQDHKESLPLGNEQQV